MLRRSILSGSWYPDSGDEIFRILKDWTDDVEFKRNSFSAISPHAGWNYSGKIAAKTLKSISHGRDLIAVIGGHLPPGSNIVAAAESHIETPLGELKNRIDLIEHLNEKLQINEDAFQDNTVEVVLPMVKFFAPDADIIWLRAPADQKSISLGDQLYSLSEKENLNIAVIGSTDLTHYGSNYGFIPAGRGQKALDWVQQENDAGLISLLIDFHLEEAISHAVENKSACSIGAAVAAARFAELKGSPCGEILDYATSYDIRPSESFVGYAGIIY